MNIRTIESNFEYQAKQVFDYMFEEYKQEQKYREKREYEIHKALHNPFFQEPDPITIFCQNNEPNPITIFLRHLLYEMSHNPIMI